jgi:hypothetical protein
VAAGSAGGYEVEGKNVRRGDDFWIVRSPNVEPSWSVGQIRHMLQKFQRNQIFEAIRAAGLDPGQFDLNYSDSEFRIKHKWSESYFTVSPESAYYVGKSLVGDGSVWPTGPSGWQSLLARVSGWLQEVKRDLDTPDLWAELQRETQLLGAGSSVVTENTPFTPDEQREIAGRLDEAAKHVSETNLLSMAKMQVLQEKIDYLITASSRFGRKDWLIVFMGVILPFILSAALPPESARTIFTTFIRSIGLLYPELPLIE